MVDSAKKTTFKNDVVPVFVTVGKVLGVFVILGTGNLLMAGLAYWMSLGKQVENKLKTS